MFKKQVAFLYIFLILPLFYGQSCSKDVGNESVNGAAEMHVERTYQYSLLDALESASIITTDLNYVGKRTLTINGEERTVLFQHPDSEVMFENLAIHKNTALEFGIGIEEMAWHKRGDGVLFEVSLVDEQLHNNVLLLMYIDPKNYTESRKWLDECIDLSDYAGQTVSLRFKTFSGPNGDAEFDWAGWSDPHLSE